MVFIRKIPFLLFFSVFLFSTLSCALSFVSYKNFDQAMPYGQNISFEISDVKIEDNDFVQKMNQIAQKNHENFYQTLVNQSMSFDVYEFIGNNDIRSKYIANNSFKLFNTDLKYRIHSADEIKGHNTSGKYYTTADSSKIQTILKDISQNIGAKCETQDIGNPILQNGNFIKMVGMFFLLLFYNHIFFLSLILVIGMFFVVAYQSAKDAKLISLHCVDGQSNARMLLFCLLRIIASFIISFATICPIGFLYLYFYNGLHQIKEFLLFSLCIILTLIITILIFQIVVFISLYSKNSIVDSIKNNYKTKTVLLISLVCQVLIFSILFYFTGSIITDYTKLDNDYKSLSKYDKIKDFSYFTIGMNATTEEAEEKLGAALHNLGSDNRVLLLKENEFSPYWQDQSILNTDFSKRNTLLVNNKYLSVEQLYDFNGKRIENLKNVSIAIPYNQKNNQKTIEKYIKQGIYDQISLTSDEEIAKNIKYDILYTKTGQTPFLYGVENKIGTFMKDPIIVFLPWEYLSNSFLVSLMSSGNLYVQNDANQNTISAFTANGSSKFITKVNSVSENVSITIADLSNKQTMNYVSLLCALIILLFTYAIFLMVYQKKNSKIIYAKFTSGHSFISIHFKHLLLSFLLPFTILMPFILFRFINTQMAFMACFSFALIGPIFEWVLLYHQQIRKVLNYVN